MGLVVVAAEGVWSGICVQFHWGAPGRVKHNSVAILVLSVAYREVVVNIYINICWSQTYDGIGGTAV